MKYARLKCGHIHNLQKEVILIYYDKIKGNAF